MCKKIKYDISLFNWAFEVAIQIYFKNIHFYIYEYKLNIWSGKYSQSCIKLVSINAVSDLQGTLDKTDLSLYILVR